MGEAFGTTFEVEVHSSMLSIKKSLASLAILIGAHGYVKVED
jgi:hypothetical protein